MASNYQHGNDPDKATGWVYDASLENRESHSTYQQYTHDRNIDPQAGAKAPNVDDERELEFDSSYFGLSGRHYGGLHDQITRPSEYAAQCIDPSALYHGGLNDQNTYPDDHNSLDNTTPYSNAFRTQHGRLGDEHLHPDGAEMIDSLSFDDQALRGPNIWPWSTTNTRQEQPYRGIPDAIASGMWSFETLRLSDQLFYDQQDSLRSRKPHSACSGSTAPPEFPNTEISDFKTVGVDSFNTEIDEMIAGFSTARATTTIQATTETEPQQDPSYTRSSLNDRGSLIPSTYFWFRPDTPSLPTPVQDTVVNIDAHHRLPMPGPGSDISSHPSYSPPIYSPSSPMSVTSESVPDTLKCTFEGCSATFTGKFRKGNLGRHQRTKHHHTVSRFLCEDALCPRTFKRTDARLKHYRKHHPYLALAPIPRLRVSQRSQESVPPRSHFDGDSSLTLIPHKSGAGSSAFDVDIEEHHMKIAGQTRPLQTRSEANTNEPKSSSGDSPGEAAFVSDFTNRLRRDIHDGGGLSGLLNISIESITQKLEVFCQRLHEESEAPLQRGPTAVLRRRRADIALRLVDAKTNNAPHVTREPSVDAREQLSDWLANVSTEASHIDDVSVYTQVHNHKKFIEQSDAYRWLLAVLTQHGFLQFAQPDIMSSIGDRIIRHLQTMGHASATNFPKVQDLATMTFDLEWNIGDFLSDFQLDPVSCDLNTFLSLTGVPNECQAIGILEYLNQTWFSTGEVVKSVLQRLLFISTGQHDTLRYADLGRKNTQVEIIRESTDMCKITVTAGAYFISDFAQQIAWLAATLRRSPYQRGLALCCPGIRGIQSEISDDTPQKISTCLFEFEFKPLVYDGDANSGLCWTSMLQNPILVTGFPIMRRLGAKPGVELSLRAMASLVKTNEIVRIGQRIAMKSFGVLLVAALATADFVVWHCSVSPDACGRVSYFDRRFDSTDLGQDEVQSLRSLETLRHVVGWCEKATDFCGHSSTNFNLKASGLEYSPSSIVIDRLYIEGGLYLIGGATMRKQKSPQASLNLDGHYFDKLQSIATYPVTFYDVDERKAWLVDGLSALLHLVRVSLQLDADSKERPYPGWRFDGTGLTDTWTGCSGRVAALNVLNNFDNLDLPVYLKGRSKFNGQIEECFSTFGDRVDKILRRLEVIIDADVYLKSQDGIKIPLDLHRRTIVGFDVLDVLKPTRPVKTRVQKFPWSGHGWSDMFSSVRMTTVFGRGFGELIRPDDPTQLCPDWRRVPAGHDYMTVTMSTLIMLHEHCLLSLNPNLKKGEITRDVSWASSRPPLEACDCLSGTVSGKRSHLDPIQILYRGKPKNAAIDIVALDPTGAVIFSNTGSPSYHPEKTIELVALHVPHTPLSVSSSDRSGQSPSVSTNASTSTGTGNSTNNPTSSPTNTTASSGNDDSICPSADTSFATGPNTTPMTIPPVSTSAVTSTLTFNAISPIVNASGANATSAFGLTGTSGIQADHQGVEEASNGKKRRNRLDAFFTERSKRNRGSNH